MSSPIRRIRERMPCISQSDKPSKRIAHVVRILEDGQVGYAAQIGKPKRRLSRVDPFDASRRQTKYTDYVGFITCIGQDDPDEYRVINNVVGPLTRGKCRFPWQSCIPAGGIFMCNVPAFTPTASSGRLRRTAIFCMDVNLKPEESACFPSMFKLTWLVSSVVILVVDEKSYGKLKKALRDLDGQTPKRPLAVVLFRSWEAQDKDGVKFTSWLTSHTDFMLSGDRDHESTLQAAEFLNDVAKIFETVSTCFMNSRDDIQPIIAEMVDSCKPLLWNNQAADLDNVNDILTNILKSVNNKQEETLPAVASFISTTVSSPTPPESKDLPKIVVKDFETLCDTYFSGAMDSIQAKDKDIQEVYKTSLRRCISKITREFPVYDTQEYEGQFEEICKNKFQSFMSQLPVDVNDNSDGNDEAEIYKVPKSPTPVNLYDLVRLEFAKIELSLFDELVNAPGIQTSPTTLTMSPLLQDRMEMANEGVQAGTVGLFKQFSRDVQAMKDTIQVCHETWTEALEKNAPLEEHQISKFSSQMRDKVTNFRFQCETEKGVLQNILKGAIDKELKELQERNQEMTAGESQEASSSASAAAVCLSVNSMTPFGIPEQTYQAYMTEALSRSFYSNENLRRLHEALVGVVLKIMTESKAALSPQRLQLLQDSLDDQFEAVQNENVQNVQRFERQRKSDIQTALETVQSGSTLFKNIDPDTLAKAGLQVIAHIAKSESRTFANLYAEEAATTIAGEVTDILGRPPTNASIDLIESDTSSRMFYVPEVLHPLLKALVDTHGTATCGSGAGAPAPKKKELEMLLNTVETGMSEREPKGFVLTSFVNDKIAEAKAVLDQANAFDFKLAQAVEQLKVVNEKIQE